MHYAFAACVRFAVRDACVRVACAMLEIVRRASIMRKAEGVRKAMLLFSSY